MGEVKARRTLAEKGSPGRFSTAPPRRAAQCCGAAGSQPYGHSRWKWKARCCRPVGPVAVELPLHRGRWRLESSYTSRLPIQVTGPGIDVTLQPNLDRGGPRWPIGPIDVRSDAPTVLTFHAEDTLLAPNIPVAGLGSIVATPDRPERIVPVGRACGRYVDWYRPGPR